MTAPNSSPQSGFPIIPKYELLEEIGHGGMATVYRAKDPRLGREVAVKVIHRHLRENSEVATRFVAEARAAAKIRHPGIVEVYDVSNEDDNERFLVVELLRGCTLRKILQDHRDMPAEIGAAIVHQLCCALEHAHASGIIHRDVKPENVLVELPGDRAAASLREAASEATQLDVTPPSFDENASSDADASGSHAVAARATPEEASSTTQQSVRDEVVPDAKRADRPMKKRGRRDSDSARKAKAVDPGVVIKVTDFGIAKILDAQGVTSTGQVLGSPAHMAPEQIEGGDVDARTDVFAIGVLLYECLVGHLPFEGKNPAQVLRRVLEGIYSPADRERPTVGGRWARIVAGTLERDASARTPSPAALAEQIEEELKAVGFGPMRAEISAFFAAPETYASGLTERLVAKLLTRGEAARKSGDIPGAAADFNRALALKPNDLAILKRASGLATTASRRVLLRRAGAVLLATLAAGSAAFGVARIVKSAPGAAPTSVAAADSSDPGQDAVDDAPEVEDDPSVAPRAPSPSGTPEPVGPAPTTHRRTHTHVRAVAPPASAVADSTLKHVTFNVYPPGARFFLDGQEQAWGGVAFSLKPGPHNVRITIEGPCCKSPHEQTINVDPARDSQQFIVHPVIHPATVRVRGPAGGKVLCDNGLAVVPGQSVPVQMTKVVLPGVSCTFTSADGFTTAKRSITITAGQTTEVDWPL